MIEGSINISPYLQKIKIDPIKKVYNYMKASIIVPTHNRKHILGRVLSYYCQQDLQKNKYEVVVVDDGSSDKTSSIFEELKDKVDYHAKPGTREYQKRIISAKHGLFAPGSNKGSQCKQDPINLIYIQLRKSGRSIARNAGILFSTYPLIIFADDDIFVEPDFVKKHIEAHSPDDMRVGMGKVIHTGDLEDPLSARWKLKDINTAFLATGNASVLKKHLIQAGLFDEDYTVYGWEDFDIGIHLEENGLESQKKNIYGYHYDPPGSTLNPGTIYDKEKERGFTAVYLYLNHPLRWVGRFTLINNRSLKILFRLLGHGNWFLSRNGFAFFKGFFRLVVRYKGYFDGIEEGLKFYKTGSRINYGKD